MPRLATATDPALVAARLEAATFRELLVDLVDVLPQLADPEAWPLDQRCAAHAVLRRAIAAIDTWHAGRVVLPTQREPIILPD